MRAVQGDYPEGVQCFDGVMVVNDLTEDIDWTWDPGIVDHLLDHLEDIDHPIAITSGANFDHFHPHIPLLSQLLRVCACHEHTLEIFLATTMTFEVNEKMLYGETFDEPEMHLFFLREGSKLPLKYYV